MNEVRAWGIGGMIV